MKKLRLKISSRTGMFNFVNPQQESVSCHIGVYKGDEVIHATSLTLDYEENPSLPTVDMAIGLLEECIKKMFIDTSREKKKKLLAFLKKNHEEIDEGTRWYRIKHLRDKRRELLLEIRQLLNQISKGKV